MSTFQLGVIVNARAKRARRDPALSERLARLLPRERVHTTAGPDDVEPALETLRAQGVDTLVVVGGDGTIGGTFTPLLRCWPRLELPAIVPTLGGTVGTIAKSLGARGRPEETVERLLAGAPLRVDTRRAIVQVSADGGAPRAGLIFINGVGVRWLEMYYRDSRLGISGASSVVARIAGSALVGGPLARRIFASFRARVVVEGKALEKEEWTIMAASSVRHVGLGFQPFYTAGDDPARIHFATTSASAVRLLRDMPALRVGIDRPDSVLEHYPARRVEIEIPEGESWSLDADTYPPAHALEISAGAALRFISP
jgi:diacylglycerol kinase family enzyme